MIGELCKKAKIVQKNERPGQEFTARGKLNTMEENWKLEAELSLK